MSRPDFFVSGDWFFLHFSDFFVVFEGNGSTFGWISGGRLRVIVWLMSDRSVNEPKTMDGRRKTGGWAKEGRMAIDN